MSDIPTTAQIRTGFAYIPNADCAMHLSSGKKAAFDRWLAVHDAEVTAAAVLDRAELADEAQRLRSWVSQLAERDADIRADERAKISQAINEAMTTHDELVRLAAEALNYHDWSDAAKHKVAAAVVAAIEPVIRADERCRIAEEILTSPRWEEQPGGMARWDYPGDVAWSDAIEAAARIAEEARG